MGSSVNFEAINSALMAGIDSHLARWLPGGDVESHEYVVLNPTRLDTKKGSFRINLTTGMWKDFALSDAKGGDLISLYAYIKGLPKDCVEAAKQLALIVGIDTQERVTPKGTKKKSPWEPVVPMPDGVKLQITNHPKHGAESMHWDYFDQDGKLLGAICRFDIPATAEKAAGKEYLPRTYCKNAETGELAWRWVAFPKPRPLYGLEKLKERPKATIIMCEGEKAADAAQRMFPKEIAMSWPGGSQAVKKADFTPIHGRKLILWPDADQPGLDAMHDVAELVGSNVEKIRFLTLPPDAPQGWDAADAGWTAEEAKAYVKANLSNPAGTDSGIAAIPGVDTYEDTGLPYRPLGYDKNAYYYMASGTRTVMILSLAQHNKAHLLGMAPLQYWEREFHSRDGVQWDMAVNKLLRSNEDIGFFSPSKIRGRGAWYDEGRIAIHLGDKVIVDGHPYSPHQTPSKFIYEAGLTMRADLENPLSNKDAQKFFQLCEILPWTKSIHSRLLAGWCVLAHIGGAMSWRPHLWVIGAKGSGKTHVMSKIVRPLLGDNCVFVQSDSTGAGIRQILERDSLPVLFDEAEGEDQYATQRLQTILGLVRQSSSDTGGVIAKGTPSGKSQSFSVRSCFAFSSINASIIQQSDKSRVTVLELTPDNYKIGLEELERMEHELLTEDYIKRFYARALSLADVIRKNAHTFARAVGAEFGEQRAGDQLGALLAGAYSLHTRDEITFDAALAWVKAQDWDEQKDEVRGQNDEDALWAHLMQRKIRVKVANGDEEFPVGLLVEIASGKKISMSDDKPMPMDKNKAGDYLMRNGIRAEVDCVYISNTSSYIKAMLKDTAWHIGWNRILARLPGATPSSGTVYYGFQGSGARSVKIPL